MNKSKFFIAAGALVLAISAFTNTNNKKYTGTSSAYFQTAGGWNTLFKLLTNVNNAPRLTDAKNTGWKTAFFRTTGAFHTLFKAKSTLNNTLFTKP